MGRDDRPCAFRLRDVLVGIDRNHNLVLLVTKSKLAPFATFYILDGTEIVKADWNDFQEWIRKGGDHQRVVKQEDFRGAEEDIRVSTVFLGICHGLSKGRPVLFETMVFGGPNDVQQRCCTYEEALKQHEEISKQYQRYRG